MKVAFTLINRHCCATSPRASVSKASRAFFRPLDGLGNWAEPRVRFSDNTKMLNKPFVVLIQNNGQNSNAVFGVVLS
jgi:hypothetical protein